MQKRKKPKDSETLTFESLYTVRGLYKDGRGNEFYIYISGDKKEVERFRRYQERQRANGIIGIRATVSKATELPKDSPEPAPQPKLKGSNKVEFRSGSVRICISRHKIRTRKPYQITYYVDPTVMAMKKQGTASAPAPFAFDLDGANADITCTVSSGTVEFRLWDVGQTATLVDGPRVISDTAGSNTGRLSATSSNTTVRWQLTATLATPSFEHLLLLPKSGTFELQYTKVFL